jgi:glycosyltransferase involved in cell wall biosynthesis
MSYKGEANMNIWLIKEGEPLPCDDNPRLMRMGLLAEELVKQDHDVTWWSSTFEHGRKRERFDKDTELKIFDDNGLLILLKTPVTYKKNTSVSRIIYHDLLGRKFIKKAMLMEKPDIIFCAFPTIHFASAAIKYGKKMNVPVILDVRDLWPDIFERALPSKLKFAGPLVLYPLHAKTNNAFRNAYGITGIIPSHLDWGITKASRERTDRDKYIYIGYKRTILSEEDRKLGKNYWESMDVNSDTWNICFFGTMSSMTMDISTLIKAFKNINLEYPKMRLILCGSGDALEMYKNEATGCSNVIFPGWIDKKQIQSLMEISKVGVYPFHNLPDFINSLTNKMIEYFSAGLPVLSTLRGFSKKYIESHEVGIVYEEGSIESCSNAILDLYHNESKRLKMSSNAKNRFFIDFESTSINNKFIKYFEYIIGGYQKRHRK